MQSRLLKKMSYLIVFPISDIHLEFRKNKIKSFQFFLPQPNLDQLKLYAPYETCLLIAGDLGYPNHKIYSDFLRFCKQRFDHIILTSGNHEYYKQNGTYVTTQTIDDKIQQVCKDIGCHYLQKSTTFIQLKNRTIHFAGCTFWSEIPTDKQSIAECNMNDFLHIMTPNFKFWKCKEFNETHQDHLNWLQKVLDEEKIDIVLTHHLPTFDLISSGYKNSDFNCCYASESLRALNIDKVKFWVCGHSHEYTKLIRNETTFLLNPLGYPGEKTFYSKDLFFVV